MSGNPFGSSDQRGRDITDLKRRLAELKAEVDALTAGAATTASDVAFTPVGGIAATNVQAALAEVDSEKAPLSHTHTKSQISDFAHTHPQSEITSLVSDLAGKAAASHSHAIGDLPVATSGTSSTTQLVRADDSRLSNARTPTAHSHAIGDLPVATSGTSSSTQLVRADDSRLSNARTPTSHSHTIADLPVATSGTSSSTQLVRADDSRLSNARAPTAHTHTASEVTDFAEAVDDRVGALLVPGTNVSITYNDAGNTLTISASASGSPYTSDTFTMNATSATSTVVANGAITATSKIIFIPTNANAFSIDGAVTSYTVAAGSMTVSHQASTLSRTFAYLVIP